MLHERGQVAHLAATTEGARAIAAAKRPLPSEWLCVFDPAVRFGTLGYLSSDVESFRRYGIDSDQAFAPRSSQRRCVQAISRSRV
jgi:hypothetical protein